MFRSAAQEVIDAIPGFSMLGEAANGQEAVALVGELRPDLVLIDVRMPEIDGVETCRRIRQLDSDAVVVLISLDDPADISALIADSGAAAFLRKQDFRGASLRALWAAHRPND